MTPLRTHHAAALDYALWFVALFAWLTCVVGGWFVMLGVAPMAIVGLAVPLAVVGARYLFSSK